MAQEKGRWLAIRVPARERGLSGLIPEAAALPLMSMSHQCDQETQYPLMSISNPVPRATHENLKKNSKISLTKPWDVVYFIRSSKEREADDKATDTLVEKAAMVTQAL